jgi:glycine/D-amino acid oxidase-like deaminating enzyme
MTRRRHTFGAAAKRRQSLICIGGPESLMDDTNDYSKEHPYPTEAEEYIRRFLKKTYRNTGRAPKYQYLWHGLMGYTPNGLRCIGAEPCNPVLLYNLGCNGVGILPSVYGGLRIAQILRGDRLSASIFDPQDQRCALPLAHEHRPAPTWFLAAFGALAIILILLMTLV